MDIDPQKYHSRNLYKWNPNVTLMRTTLEENVRIGELIAAAANAATGPVAILLPLKGVSQLDSPGGLFWDPAADAACYDTIKAKVKPGVPVIDLDLNINDPEFADKAVECCWGWWRRSSNVPGPRKSRGHGASAHGAGGERVTCIC